MVVVVTLTQFIVYKFSFRSRPIRHRRKLYMNDRAGPFHNRDSIISLILSVKRPAQPDFTIAQTQPTSFGARYASDLELYIHASEPALKNRYFERGNK